MAARAGAVGTSLDSDATFAAVTARGDSRCLFLWLGFFLLRFLVHRWSRPPLRVIDNGNDFADLYFLAFGHFRLKHTGFFGHDVGGDLVGLQSKERFAFIHELPGLFVPGRDDSARDRFSNRRNFDFNDHRRDT